MDTQPQSPLLTAVAAEMRAARARRDLTIREAADLAGVHYVSLSRYEQGRQAPSIDVLDRIARAYGLTARDLIPAS